MVLRSTCKCAVVMCFTVGVAACGASTTEPIAHSGSAVVMGEQPTEVYAKIARLVRACWFKPSDPVLSRHIFHADVPADGTGAVISIYEADTKRSRGRRAYSITFKRRLKATQIETENRLLAYALAQKLTADVNRWSQGNEACQSFANSGAPTTGRGSHSGLTPSISQPVQKSSTRQ